MSEEDLAKIITYKNEASKGIYCQLKFKSGEKILVSMAKSGVAIYKLALFGLIPGKLVWKSSDVATMIAKFVDSNEEVKHPLDSIVAKVRQFKSISDLQSFLGSS